MTLEQLRDAIMKVEKEFGTIPVIMLSCAGYSDEHWQFWHPDDLRVMEPNDQPMPRYVMGSDGVLREHPDGKKPRKTVKWHYNTHDVITRIPEQVGVVWENGYGVKLGSYDAVGASSSFSGAHQGTGSGRGHEVMLAIDESGNYLLIKERPIRTRGQ